ncbi:hypothetical protein MED222_04875 [Vibrio sp. MED222]|nr:hypothetical protein MED222_04875 [Vibrio sp. MED222]
MFPNTSTPLATKFHHVTLSSID